MLMLSKMMLALAVLSPLAQADNALVQLKLRQRAEIMKHAARPLHQSRDKEESNLQTPAYFLDLQVNELRTNLNFLQQVNHVDISAPYWSGYYWPNYVGGLGYRYNDNYFPKGQWYNSLNYVKARPSSGVSLDLLSPSEKYDLAMGVSPEEVGSLTTQQWNLARAEYKDTRKVETWQGICNGWAAASITLPTPLHPVVIPSARGDLTFQTEDIKALGSLLFAAGQFESVFNGFRCDEEEPSGDGAHSDKPECFDINPADWHLLVLHQIGMARRPFIIDYIQSKEVWNKPVVGFDVTYFNIKSRGEKSQDFREVVQPAKRVIKYRRTRSPKAAFMVGVNMQTKLLFGANEDSHVGQTLKSVEYVYFLELDAAYNIVGGEWETENHPDFAWRPKLALQPGTPGDALVHELGLEGAYANPTWRQAALLGDRIGSPLPKFVSDLFFKSSN